MAVKEKTPANLAIHPILTALGEALGPGAVAFDAATRDYFSVNTLAQPVRPLAVVRPASVDHIRLAVRLANRHRVPLYPISGGRNWGYGSACAVGENQIVLDLAAMNAICDYDEQLGVVTVEPGVTQQMLYDFLRQRGDRYMVPVTGAGPSASILGNLLERGYGVTPYADHFAATTAIEAVLPDASIYRTPISTLGGAEVDGLFKWGLGPYADGLFTQGSFGIVTRATILLAPRPQRIEAFFFSVGDDGLLEDAVERVRLALRAMGPGAGSMNLMNRRRVLAMTEPYPHDQRSVGGVLSDAVVEAMGLRRRLGAWIGAGAIYGSRALVAAARSELRRRLAPVCDQLRFISEPMLDRIERALRLVPAGIARHTRSQLPAIRNALTNFAGRPNRVALPLAYWGTKPPPEPDAADPDRDGCGLIWYSPLVPMRGADVRQFVSLAEATCREHAVEPLVTLTALSDRVFDATVPLLFDPSMAGAAHRAHACYAALFDRGREAGFVPYRVGINAMDKVVDANDPYWKMIAAMKTAIDPNHIIAPGRYCPPGRNE